MVEPATSTAGVVRILGVHHMGIPCNDLDRAAEFYTRVLGMTVIGATRGSDGRAHFLGVNLPPHLKMHEPAAEAAYREYLDLHARARPERKPETHFIRLLAGDQEVVLFQRLEADQTDTLLANGIFHQSFHVSKADLDRLADLTEGGDSGIRFHTGPALRWPHGRAIYLWDTEGNYLELESEEDLQAANP